MDKIYLDNSSTTKQYQGVTEAMVRYMREDFGNPSSLHRLGITAEKAVKEARKTVAAGLCAGSDEVYFTSGGTEADNTAIFGAASARKRRGNKIITSAVEHPAVLEACGQLSQMGYKVSYIPVDKACRLDMEQLDAELDRDTILISIMAVNNETGTVMPLEKIAELKNAWNRKQGAEVLFHTDAVQAFGKMAIPLAGVDMLSLSAHKIHGPKGIGALYIRKGLKINPTIVGGGQERHFRSGTENVPAIAGFGTAVSAFTERDTLEQRIAHLSSLRTYLLEGICDGIREIRINGPSADICACTDEKLWNYACPSVLSVSFLGTRGEVLLHTLEQEGIYVSTGSACSSNKKGQSHVLSAMGLNEKEIEGTIRFSFSEFNTIEEMEIVLDRLKAGVNKFRKLGSFR